MSATVLLRTAAPSSQPVNAALNGESDDVQCDSLRADDRPELPDFYQALIDIDEELGEEDTEGLKFLCRDHISVSKLAKAETSLEVFDTMKKLSLIAENNYDYLLECLARIHRLDLVKKLGFQPGAVKDFLPHFKKLLPFRVLLMDIIEDMDDQEAEKIRFFLRGRIRKKLLNDKKSLLQLFVFMEQEGLMAPTKLELLTAVLESIRRGDLVDMIREFQELPPLQRHEPGLNRNAVVPSEHESHIRAGQGSGQSDRQTQDLNQQRVGLVQSGSAGTLSGSEPNSPFNRSVSAGTLSVTSEENVEVPSTRMIPNPLLQRIANDVEQLATDLGFELGFTNDQLAAYTEQIPDPKARTLRILTDWQNGVVDKGQIASGLHFVLTKLGCKNAAGALKQWIDSFNTNQWQLEMSGFAPAGPPEESENHCMSLRTAQPIIPANQLQQQQQQLPDNIQVLSDLEQLHINPTQLTEQHKVRFVNGGIGVYKQGNKFIMNPGISQPLQPFVVQSEDQMIQGQGQIQPGMPVVHGDIPVGNTGQLRVAPGAPQLQTQVPAAMQIGQGHLQQDVNAVPVRHEVNLTGPLAAPGLPSYRMNRNPRGWCVILNNEKFYVDRNERNSDIKEMPSRNGTEKDAATLTALFDRLGFVVRRHDNLTDTQMMNVMIDVAHNVDHTNFDCFVCCILTHGVLGNLYGSNGKLISIKDLTSTFQTNRCPTLAGKPKLFFLQACQGRDKMEGGEIQADGPNPVPATDAGGDLQIDTGAAKEMIPNEADFLLGYATVPGYVSFRSRNHGSWYIRKLCELLEKYANSYDLMSILVEVNNEVAAANANMDGGLYKQIPAPLVTLRKRLFMKYLQ